MTKLSLAMIVKDEIDSLERCLDSVAGLVDEVCIVDTGSTDGTAELARERADHFLERPWDDDFSAARNASLDLATGDWVLVLDADEEFQAHRRDLRMALEGRTIAYRLSIQNDLGDGKSGEHRACRLFRRHPGLRFRGRIHEQVEPALAEILSIETGWQVSTLVGASISHHGYEPGLFARRGKAERNLRLLQIAVAEQPDDAYLSYKLSRELGDSEEGRAELLRSAALFLAMPSAVIARQAVAPEALSVAALTCADQGRSGTGESAARLALELVGEHPVARYALARNLSLQGRSDEAVDELRLSLSRSPSPSSFHFDATAQDLASRLELAETLFHEASPEEGLAVLREARSLHSGAGLDRAWLKGLLAAGEPADALREGLMMLKQEDPDPTVLLLLAEAAEVCGRADLAERWRDQVGELAHA